MQSGVEKITLSPEIQELKGRLKGSAESTKNRVHHLAKRKLREYERA